MAQIGQVIRDVRKRKGLTQSDLAKAAGLSTMSIRRYENGERTIPESTLQVIANALDYPFDELMSLDDALAIVNRTLSLGVPDFEKKLSQYTQAEIDAHLAKIKAEDDARTSIITDAVNRSSVLNGLIEKYPLALSRDFLQHHDTIDLLSSFNVLNDDGKQEAIRSVEIIAGNPIYQRTDPTQSQNSPSDALSDAEQGNSSTTNKKPPEGQNTPADGK